MPINPKIRYISYVNHVTNEDELLCLEKHPTIDEKQHKTNMFTDNTQIYVQYGFRKSLKVKNSYC